MTSDEFEKVQQEWAVPALSSLVRDCQRKYLRAASHLQVRGDHLGRLRHASTHGGLDLSPLFPFWHAVCDRYRSDRYDPQQGLFQNHETTVAEQWGHFVYHELFPALYQEDEGVRNALRAVELLPSRSARGAAKALLHYAEDMALPGETPPWDPTEQD